MLFLTQTQVLESFLGSCLSDRYAPQAGQTGLDESVGAGEDFAFFSGLESFEILGEGSDRDVDLSLSLSLSSSPFLCPYFSGHRQPVVFPRAKVSVGFDGTAPHRTGSWRQCPS